MAELRNQSPRLSIDVLVVAVGAGLELLAAHCGVRAGQDMSRGVGTVLAGISVIYLGALFLLSYFFPNTSYLLSFLRFVCEGCSSGGKGRHMALLYFAGALVFGGWLVLFGLRVF